MDNILDQSHTLVDSIFWLGDNPGHDVYDQEVSNHLDNVKIISKRLKEVMPHIGQVYPVIGNHEGFPCDQFDLFGTTHQWILNDIADMWKQWLTPQSYLSIKQYGRYSQLHPGTTLRILAINSFVFDSLNSYLWGNNTDPQKEIEWIEGVLRNAEKSNETVLIIGHIPPTMINADESIFLS